MTEEMVLYGESNWESPYVFSCFVALREKGIPFELRTWTLAAGEHRRGDYANRSVTGRVPALAHGDFWLAESSAVSGRGRARSRRGCGAISCRSGRSARRPPSSARAQTSR